MNRKTDPCILYIEDNTDSRTLIRRILEAEGYTVVLAPDGRTGLALAATHRPDLILMDVNMPEMDGYTIASQIKTRPELAGVKVIALTANALIGDRERALAAGYDAYMQKPLDLDRFLAEIAQLLAS